MSNSYDQKGYLYTEAKTDAPYLGTTEEQLERHLTRTGRRGLTLNAYIIGSQTNKMLNGTYFDQGSTWSRVLGSRDGDRVVDAYFGPDGYLGV